MRKKKKEEEKKSVAYMTPRSFDLFMFMNAQCNCAMRFAESSFMVNVRGRKERESSGLNQHGPLFFFGTTTIAFIVCGVLKEEHNNVNFNY